MSPRNPVFKALQDKWYKRLAKKGFNDIEQGQKLKRFDVDWFHNHITTVQYESTVEFYTQCEIFGRAKKFPSKRDRVIWEAFSQGKTFKGIEPLVDIQEDMIGKVVKKYVKEMRDSWKK